MALARLRTGIAHVVQMLEDDQIDNKDAITYLKEMNRVENQNVRVPSAYNLFVRERLNALKEAGVPNKERMSIISNKWKQLPDDEKAPYIEKRQSMINEKNDQMKTLQTTLTNKKLVRIIQPKKSKKNDTANATNATNATSVTTVVRVRENSPMYSPRRVTVPSPRKTPNKELAKETEKRAEKVPEKAPERPIMPFVNKAKYDLPKRSTMTVTEEEIEHERQRKERRRIKKEKIAAKQIRQKKRQEDKKKNDRPSEIQPATDQDNQQKTDDYNDTSGEESPVSPLSQSSASEQEKEQEQPENNNDWTETSNDESKEGSNEESHEESHEDTEEESSEEDMPVITQPVKAASTSGEASTSAQAPTTWIISRSTASTSQQAKRTKKTTVSKPKKQKKPPKEESEESEWASDDPRYDDDYVPPHLLSRNQPILAPAGPPIRIKTWSLDEPDSEEERENAMRCVQGFHDLVREHPEYMYDSEEGCTKEPVTYENDSDDDVDPQEMAEANERMMKMMRWMEERNAIALAKKGSSFLDNP